MSFGGAKRIHARAESSSARRQPSGQFLRPRRRNARGAINFSKTWDGGCDLHDADGMFSCSRFIYVLRSVRNPARYYTGLTENVAQRLATHNSGGSQHTRHHRPWELVVSLEFATESSAVAFEKYLKTGSGRAFAKRHFV